MIDYTTFDSFIASTNGQSIGQGECWDYINLLWSHLNHVYYTYPPTDPTATNHGVKWGVLNADAKSANIVAHITFISSIQNVTRGDVVVTSGGVYGHAGFINEGYSENKTTFDIYSQNYNNRRSVALDTYSLNDFAGAFRYDAWSEPSPTPVNHKYRFPFVLYAKRLRELREGNMV